MKNCITDQDDTVFVGVKQVTAEDVARGYVVCNCGKFAHILSAKVLPKLPKGYSGERCPTCNLWMCAVDKLPKEETNGENQAPHARLD